MTVYFTYFTVRGEPETSTDEYPRCASANESASFARPRISANGDWATRWVSRSPTSARFENEKLDFGDYPSEDLIRKLARAVDTDVDELLIPTRLAKSARPAPVRPAGYAGR